MDINTAYEFIKDLVNKDQKGFVPSAKFNRYAQRAQMEVFMQRYGNPKEYQPERPIPKVAYAMTQKIHDDLRPFIQQATLHLNKYGQAFYLSDYVHPSSISYTVTKKGKHQRVPVKVVSDDKLAYRLSSRLVAPSKEYPICALYAQYLQFYPENLVAPNFTYLRQPKVPQWGFTIVNGREVYDPANSVDWEFPDEVHNEICIKVLSYIGIKLRESDLLQYAELKNGQGI